MRINYLHEMVENGTVQLKYIDTLNNVADILTKPLPIFSHEHFTETLQHGHGGVIPEPKSKVIYKSKKKILSFKRDRGARKKSSIPMVRPKKKLFLVLRSRTGESRLEVSKSNSSGAGCRS
jgi:hypothetical protein